MKKINLGASDDSSMLFVDAASLNFDGLESFWHAGAVQEANFAASEAAVAARARLAAFVEAIPRLSRWPAAIAKAPRGLASGVSGLLRLGQAPLADAAKKATSTPALMAASAVAMALCGAAIESGMLWSIHDQMRELRVAQNNEGQQNEAQRQSDALIALQSSRVPGWAKAGLRALAPNPTSAPSWIPGAAKKAQKPKLLALPVALDDKNPMNPQQLAAALLPKDPFLAMATQVERPATEPYFDAAGANIGMGYCIPQRRAAYGDQHVREDFAMAGINGKTIELLMSADRKAVETARITQAQALRLLMITKEDYLQRAKKVVGADVFDSLSVERQSALAYLSYNSNLGGFRRLPQAIAAGHETEAMREMTPSFRTEKGGKLQRNYRLASYLWAAWTGRLGQALSDPAEHERLYAHPKGLAALIKDNKSAPKDPGVSAPQKPAVLARETLHIQQQMGPPEWAARFDPVRQPAAQVARELAFPPAPANMRGSAATAAKASAVGQRAAGPVKLNPAGAISRRAAAPMAYHSAKAPVAPNEKTEAATSRKKPRAA